MKKLISLLGAFSLTATGASGVIACNIEKTNEQKIYFNQNVNEITCSFSNKNNLYFGTNNGAFVLQNKTNIAFKINGIDGEIRTINGDSKDNIYFAGNKVWKMLCSNINDIINISGFSNIIDIYSTKIDKNDDVYFGGVFIGTILYKLENNSNDVIALRYQKNNTMPRSNENSISNLIIVNDYIYVLKNNFFVFYDKKEKQFNSIKGYNENEDIQTAVYYNNNLYFGTNEKLYKLRINDKEAIKVNNIIGYLNNLISFKNKLFYSKNKNEIYSLFYSKNKNLYWIWIIISLLILLIIIIILFVIKFKVKKSNYRKTKRLY